MNAYAFDTEGFLFFLSDERPYNLDWNVTLEELTQNVIDLFLDKYWNDREGFIHALYIILPGRVSPDDIERFIESSETE